MRKAIWLGVLIVWFSVALPAATGQNLGQVEGTVEDPTGIPVAQAEVKLTSQTTGTAPAFAGAVGQVPTSRSQPQYVQTNIKAVTDEAGHFAFTGVAPGEYVLSVRVQGFEKAELQLKVGSSPTPAQRVRLKVATVTDEITVSAQSSDPLSSDQNTTAVQVDHELLRSLPSKDANPLAVASLFVDPSANGAEGTKIVVDGVEGNELDVPASSVKSVSVNKNPYSAEFGRPGKGRIEVVTRGGSQRRFHSRLTFTFRDASLDARNAFAKVRPPMQRELSEGQIDGPLAGGKATFFLGGEFLKDNQSAFIRAQTPSGLLAENFGTSERAPRLLGRIDVRLTPLQILSVRYNWSRDSLGNQGVGAFDLPERAWNSTNETHEGRISETAIPSANFSNEVRFDFRSRAKEAQSLSDAPAILVLGAFHSGGGQISLRNAENAVDFQDLVSYIHGKHTFRFGAIVKSRLIDFSDSSNFGGTFTFSDLASLASRQPFKLTVNRGDPRASFTQHEFAYFFQDEMRFWPRFGLLLGLRHELQSNLHYYKNLAPRVALAYTTANGQTVLRAGAGIFYQRQPVTLEEQSLLLDGSHLRQIVISNPSFPLVGDPSALANLPPPSVVRIDPNIRAAYAIQTSLGVERKLGRQSYLSAEYTMLRGLELYRMRDVNAPLPATGLRPDPNFLNMDQFETSGSSHSHSFNLGVRTSLRGRLQLVSQYTLSHAIDDTSGLTSLPADNFDLRGERGRADFDQRHRFNLAGVLKLPHGFGFGLVASVSSGIPYNITTGFDNNHDTVANDRPSLGNPNAPFTSFGIDGSFIGKTPGVLYDGAKALFAGSFLTVNANDVHWLILPGTGNIGRNIGNGPGFVSLDLRSSKKFKLWNNREKENRSPELEFRIDAFNILNHVNRKNFVGPLSSPFFGRANAAHSARELQASAKFIF